MFELLSAYAKLDEQTRHEVGLVFAGDGSRPDATWRIRPLPSHREPLATYCALAKVWFYPRILTLGD